MTFKERYDIETHWTKKVMIMEIYHLAMTQTDKRWTLADTAAEFEVSIGLVSENLKLADALHSKISLMECQSRQEALKSMRQ